VPATIRPATVDDVEAFVSMKNDAWRWAYTGILPDEHLDALTIDAQVARWRDRFARPGPAADWVFVAVDEDRVVGVAGAGPSRDDDATPSTGELAMLYLDRDHLGRGLGRALHDRALDALRAASYTRATLWVLEANQRGRGFYGHVGWTPDGTRSDHMVECANFPMVRYAIGLSA
jgi:GNAT superfamily N-acetyltransferase